jgi:hypothetical protein
MENHSDRPSNRLTIDALVGVVGLEAFEMACKEAMSVGNESMVSEVPHDLSGRLWFDGGEPLGERLAVAVELYRRMPSYANLMYWRYSEFDEFARARMWDAFREFLADPWDPVAQPAAYSLWVDYFEDRATVDRAWREVSGPQEPRRPRLERVLRVSGPVPWALKESLYEELAAEGGWGRPLADALYGSCIDVYGSLDRMRALRILRSLRESDRSPIHEVLARILENRHLPAEGHKRRSFVANLNKKA